MADRAGVEAFFGVVGSRLPCMLAEYTSRRQAANRPARPVAPPAPHRAWNQREEAAASLARALKLNPLLAKAFHDVAEAVKGPGRGSAARRGASDGVAG